MLISLELELHAIVSITQGTELSGPLGEKGVLGCFALSPTQTAQLLFASVVAGPVCWLNNFESSIELADFFCLFVCLFHYVV